MEKSRKIRKAAKIAAVIFTAVLLFAVIMFIVSCGKGGEEGAVDGVGGESGDNNQQTEQTDGNTQEPKDMEGIVITDVKIEYDGESHGIEITGVPEGAITEYSSDGENYGAEEIKFTEQGEYEIFVRVNKEGYNEYKGKGKVTITRTILTGIETRDRTYIYDGENKELEIQGVEETDEIEYSIDGENWEERIQVKEPGEYEIRYRVERKGKGYYNGMAKIEILPDMSGKYVNEIQGIIEIEKDKVKINGQEKSMEYDVNGKGTIDGKEMKRVQNGIEVEQIQYEKTEKQVYRINGKYYIDENTVEIQVTIKDNNAEIEINGKTIQTKKGNYVERITRNGKGIELQRTYENQNVQIQIQTDGNEEVIEVEISERKTETREEIKTKEVCDGTEKKIEITKGENEEVLCKNGNGEYVKEISGYTEVGVYNYEFIILKDGYLPIKQNGTMEIAEDISGTYYRADGIVKITGNEIEINGIKTDIEVKKTETGIEIEGNEYKKQTEEKLIVVRVGSEAMVMVQVGHTLYIARTGTKIRIYYGETVSAGYSEDLTKMEYIKEYDIGKEKAVVMVGNTEYEMTDMYIGADEAAALTPSDLGDSPVTIVDVV